MMHLDKDVVLYVEDNSVKICSRFFFWVRGGPKKTGKPPRFIVESPYCARLFLGNAQKTGAT